MMRSLKLSRRLLGALTAFSLTAASSTRASAQAATNPQRAALTAKFREQLAGIARAADGVVGIAVIDLASGERFGVNESLVFPQGSAIKIPILIELFRQAESGTVSLADRMPVRAADQVGGTGVAQYFGNGESMLSLRDLAVLMIALSDNTATNLLIPKLGMASVNGTMVSLGAPSVKLQRMMIRPRESAMGNENIATPADAAALMGRIHTCALPMSREKCNELRRILELPRDGAFPASVPGSVRVAWKPGSVEGVETAWGLFALAGDPYVLTVMVNYSDGAPAQRTLRAVADAAFTYFTRVARSTKFGVRVPLTMVDSIRR